MNSVNSYICARVRRLREERKLRVQDMAQRTGIPLGSYSCLETGRYRMNLENLFRIQHVLGVAITELYPCPATPEPAQRVSDAYIEAVLKKARSMHPPLIGYDDILRAVCAVFNVAREDLASPSRRRVLAEARTVATCLVAEQRHLTLAKLGQLLGRDPSSLSHCRRRLHERLTYDRALRQRLQEARRELEQRTGQA